MYLYFSEICIPSCRGFRLLPVKLNIKGAVEEIQLQCIQWSYITFILTLTHINMKFVAVNSVSWAPHECGLLLACGSSDGSISLLSSTGDGNWTSKKINNAHTVSQLVQEHVFQGDLSMKLKWQNIVLFSSDLDWWYSNFVEHFCLSEMWLQLMLFIFQTCLSDWCHGRYQTVILTSA